MFGIFQNPGENGVLGANVLSNAYLASHRHARVYVYAPMENLQKISQIAKLLREQKSNSNCLKITTIHYRVVHQILKYNDVFVPLILKLQYRQIIRVASITSNINEIHSLYFILLFFFLHSVMECSVHILFSSVSYMSVIRLLL